MNTEQFRNLQESGTCNRYVSGTKNIQSTLDSINLVQYSIKAIFASIQAEAACFVTNSGCISRSTYQAVKTVFRQCQTVFSSESIKQAVSDKYISGKDRQ